MTRRATPPASRPPGYEQWRPGEFEIAQPINNTPARVTGWTYRGLGLHRASAILARYQRKDGTRRLWQTWTVTHLNTGHAARWLHEVEAERAFELATDLVDLADWAGFDGLDGWRNVDPDLPCKLQSWHERNRLKAVRGGGGQSDEQARAIGSRRW